MRWFWQKKGTVPPAIQFGIEETGQLSKGEVYHAAGTLRQSSGYKHRIVIGVSAIADFTQIDDSVNSHVVATILRTGTDASERRRYLQVDATALFTREANFAIDIVAIPKVGDRQILLRRGLCIRVASLDSVAIARSIGAFSAAVLSDIKHDSLMPFVPEPFQKINALMLITKSSVATCHFWHNVVLTSYSQSVDRVRKK